MLVVVISMMTTDDDIENNDDEKTLEGEILLKPAGAKCIFEISLKQMLG